MALKKLKPMTPGQRGVVLVARDDLHKGKPHKPLTEGMRKTGGRNNTGHVTSINKSGGHKRRYRLIDFRRVKQDVIATVDRLEYDPNRTAFIALVTYADGEKSYILAPQKLAAGDKIVASEKTDVKPGNAMLLKNMPIGTIIYNVEMKPGKGGQLARSAGCYAQLVGKDRGYVQIKLNSGELRLISGECMASIGAVSNPDQRNVKLGKAGRNRWMGVKPHTRGVVKNPVDHPHGGGEGRTSGGRHPVTPWGKITRGLKTRKNKLTTKFILRNRHQAKKK